MALIQHINELQTKVLAVDVPSGLNAETGEPEGAAIKASVTSLISRYPRTEARREELLSIVDEETDRLHRIVSEAIQMARIDAGKVSLQRSPHALHEIVTGALGGLKLSPARVRCRASPCLSSLRIS